MNVPVDGVSEDPEEFERHRNQEFAMRVRLTQCLSVLAVGIAFWGCRDQPTTSAPSTTVPLPSATAPTDDADPADDAVPAPTVRSAAALAALLPSNGTGCAPATRCIRVSTNGRPQAERHVHRSVPRRVRLAQNEPWLGSALRVVAGLVEDCAQQGIPSERLVVLGFSQGACLTLEFAARHACRYAPVVAFTGGLIGPPGTPREYAGDFADTPVFIGSSDVDPHVPLERVQESTAVFQRMGASVDERIYPRMGRTINADELRAAAALLVTVSR